MCSVQSRDGVLSDSEACGDGDGRLSVSGNNTECALSIDNVGIGDSGDWTCVLTDHHMDTVKHHTLLEVVQHGDLSLNSNNVGEVYDGDTVELICELEQVWPVSELRWSWSSGDQELIQVSEPIISSECDQCPVSVRQSAFIRVSLDDDGAEVRCSDTGDSHALTTLEVRALQPANNSQLIDFSKKIGVLPGVVISAILVLLSIAILISFCVRGSRKRKHSIVTNISETDPELGKNMLEKQDIIKDADKIEAIENVYDESNEDKSLTDHSLDSVDTSENNTSSSDAGSNK